MGSSPFEGLPFSNLDSVLGVGLFDGFDSGARTRLLWKLRRIFILPPRPAVLTYHNDSNRTGMNDREDFLVASEVKGKGLKFARAVDLGGDAGDDIYTQILYVPGLKVGNTMRDVGFVGTTSNRLIGFDVNSGEVVINPPAFKDFETNSPRQVPNGIRGTPVIDSQRKTMYFVFGDRKEQDILVETDVAFWLVAWDLEGNKERAHVKLAGSYPRSDRTSVSFEANQQGQRAALLLTGGVVHVAFAMRPPETDVR